MLLPWSTTQMSCQNSHSFRSPSAVSFSPFGHKYLILDISYQTPGIQLKPKLESSSSNCPSIIDKGEKNVPVSLFVSLFLLYTGFRGDLHYLPCYQLVLWETWDKQKLNCFTFQFAFLSVLNFILNRKVFLLVYK